MELINKTIVRCFLDQAAVSAERIALEADGQCYTWSDLNELSNRMAAIMLEDGVGRGTHVAIWSTNSPNWVITFLALEKIGAVAVLLNTGYRDAELLQVLRYADVTHLYYGDSYKKMDYQEIVDRLKPEMDGQIIRWVRIGRSKMGRWMEASSLPEIDEATRACIDACIAAQDSQDTAAILFTSGTTASPKGVMLSHYNLVNSSLETCGHMRWNRDDKMLIAVPMFHCFGITSSLLSSIHIGFSMYMIEYYKTMVVLEKLQNEKCTLLNGVPSMFLAITHNPNHRAYDLSALRSGIIAGSSISREEYLEIRREIPGLKLHSSYGQTESSPCVSIGDEGDTDEESATTAGRVIENIEVGIFDITTGRRLECGENGEIRIRGYNVMKGYYNLPEETRKTVDAEGWLHSGDLGYLDERNFLIVTGRIKELIIRGGENISPREIEEVILTYPGIQNAKVIGLPVAVLQEMIVACIVTDVDSSVSPEALIEYLKPRLAYYKIPVHVLEFEKLPMNVSGKIMLGALKEAAAKRINMT